MSVKRPFNVKLEIVVAEDLLAAMPDLNIRDFSAETDIELGDDIPRDDIGRPSTRVNVRKLQRRRRKEGVAVVPMFPS